MIDPKTLSRHEKDVLQTFDHVEITVDVARDYFDGMAEFPQELFTQIDSAQGHVFSDAGPVAYVLIKITK